MRAPHQRPAERSAPASHTPGTSRSLWSGALAIPVLLALAVFSAVAGLIATGAAAPASLVPASPLVTWGMPVVIALHHLGLLLAVGAGGTVVLLLSISSRREVDPQADHRFRTTR